jgi:hypothetical protein
LWRSKTRLTFFDGAWETALGLLAQRLFTVSTTFASATVIDVQNVEKVYWIAGPKEETWFEIVVDIQVAATQGGHVTPGALA